MTDLPTVNAHRDIEELLPWYVNDTLTPDERLTVERHLAQCPACQMELEQCRALAHWMREPAKVAWRPSADHFDQLMTDIDRLSPPPAQTKSVSVWWRRLLEGLQATPAPMRWILATQSVALTGLLLALLPAAQLNDPGYETLSTHDALPAMEEPRLRVAFAEPMTVGELRALLRDIGGQIVAGPTALGVYTIAVTSDERLAEAQSRALTRLRAHEQVRLAEPLPPR